MDKRVAKRNTVRKTVDLDADVVKGIEQIMLENPTLKKKQVINDLMRKGLIIMSLEENESK